MTAKLLTLIFLLGACGTGAAQQHARRPVKPVDNGPVTVMRSATLQVYIASDAVSVFNFLADQDKLAMWLSDQAILEAQFGGKYHLRFQTEDPVDGVVTEIIPANTLALTWKHPNDEAETQVRFRLSPQGGRTLVELDHQGFTSTDALDKAVTAWVFNLKNLKSVVEDQTDLRKVAPKTPTHTTTHATTRPRPK
jgi:uncharacterized protein YndB with AHSA1/START domain